MKTQGTFNTLNEMLSSNSYHGFESDRLGNNLFINDPDRADRIYKASVDGSDGSTHQERIDDWRDFLDTLQTFDATDPDDTGDVSVAVEESIRTEIDACEQWHIKNGSINQSLA